MGTITEALKSVEARGTEIERLFNETQNEEGRLIRLPLDKLKPNPYQPRTHVTPESIAKKRAEMIKDGQLQPILVRVHPEPREATAGIYQIIDGETRWRGAAPTYDWLGLPELDCIVRNVNDLESLIIAFASNDARESLSDYDECVLVCRFADEYLKTQTEIMTMLGKTRGWVANRIAAGRVGADLKEVFADHDEMSHVLVIEPVSPYKPLPEHLKTETAKTVRALLIEKMRLGATVENLTESRKTLAPDTYKLTKTPTAPVPTRPDTSEAANGNAAANGSTIFTRSYETPARPAQTVQTTIEYPNSPIIESPYMMRYPREYVMEPEGVAALLDRCEVALPVFINEYSRLQQGGAWAQERRIEMRQKLQNIIHFAESAIKAVDEK